MMTKYGFLGTGNMAKAMINGLLQQNILPKDILVSSPNSAARLSDELGVIALPAQELINQSDMVILAFLPNQLKNITSQLNFKNRVVTSVLAGVTLHELSQAINTTQIVRALPNVNVSLNQGVTALTKTELISSNQLVVDRFWSLLGKQYYIAEDQFAVFSAVAGSAPAYVFKFIDALAKSGADNGLSFELATEIVTQTVIGSANTLANSDKTAQQLQDMVASPGGSTRAGLDDFNQQNFDDVVAHAIQATINHKHL